jgi:hypothetical protein
MTRVIPRRLLADLADADAALRAPDEAARLECPGAAPTLHRACGLFAGAPAASPEERP